MGRDLMPRKITMYQTAWPLQWQEETRTMKIGSNTSEKLKEN